MKKITFTIATFLITLLISCSGSDGRDGIDGVDGMDGANANLAIEIFEIEPDFELNANNNYYRTIDEFYPDLRDIGRDAVVLIYRLEFFTDEVDVWRQLPQPYFINEGTLYYNFDYTFFGFTIYLEADFDISTTDLTEFIEGQIFRVVVIPSEMVGLSSKTDLSDFNSVISAYGLDENNIQRID